MITEVSAPEARRLAAIAAKLGWLCCERRPGAGVAVPEVHQRHRFVGVPAALGREAWTQRCKGENAIATARGSVYLLHRIRPEVALLRAGHFFVSRVAIGRRCHACASRVAGK